MSPSSRISKFVPSTHLLYYSPSSTKYFLSLFPLILMALMYFAPYTNSLKPYILSTFLRLNTTLPYKFLPLNSPVLCHPRDMLMVVPSPLLPIVLTIYGLIGNSPLTKHVTFLLYASLMIPFINPPVAVLFVFRANKGEVVTLSLHTTPQKFRRPLFLLMLLVAP